MPEKNQSNEPEINPLTQSFETEQTEAEPQEITESEDDAFEAYIDKYDIQEDIEI